MANETTTTTLDDLCQAIIAEARMVLSQGIQLKDYVSVRPLPRGKSGVLYPKYGAVTVAAVSEATDLANQAVSTSGVTITPTEFGGMTTVTDLADWKSNPTQVGADIGKLFGNAIRAIQNQTIWALFDGFTQVEGTSNTDITEANIVGAVQQLMSAQAPRPYYLAITPHVFEDLLTLYSTNTNNTSADIRNAVLNKGVLPPIYGVIPLLVDNLASGSSAGKADAADAKCGMFSREAIGYVEMTDIKLEMERDASLRANEIVATTVFAAGEVEDTFGVELLVDNKD